MSKYSIEGDIDFYKELNDSGFNSNNNGNNENICLITQLPLEEKYITLKCKHTFNYTALYKDIYNSKFRTTSINTGVSQYPTNRIKCPYCRSLQSTLLPYYAELGFPLVYGINTNNIVFNIVKNNKNKFVYDSSMTYFNGECCFEISPGEKCFHTTVLLHSETQKTYCYQHIHTVKKEYNKQLKDAKKQKMKEELKLKKLKEKEDKKKEKPIVILCNQILKTGKNKGKWCGCKVTLPNVDKCKKHIPKEMPSLEQNISN